MVAFGARGTIERMSRRLLVVLVSALASALAGCGSTPPPPPPPVVAAPSAPASAPPSAAPSAAPSVSAAPAVPRGTAPARTYDVATRALEVTRAGRDIAVTVWYPQAARRFPLVLFSHGLGGRPADYAELLSRWAAAGFVVAAPAYPYTNGDAPRRDVLDVINQPADASSVIDRVLALDRRAGDPLAGRLLTDRVAAAGHSAGGITTVGLFTGGRDDRLDAGIVLAGSSLGVGTAFRGTAAPQLFVHGERDDVVSYAAGRAAYDAVPWPKALLSLPEGDHRLGTGDDGWDVVAGTTVEFLRWTLYGDPAAKARIPDGAAQGGVAVLDDRL
jgi:dienelactone hydrolase